MVSVLQVLSFYLCPCLDGPMRSALSSCCTAYTHMLVLKDAEMGLCILPKAVAAETQHTGIIFALHHAEVGLCILRKGAAAGT